MRRECVSGRRWQLLRQPKQVHTQVVGSVDQVRTRLLLPMRKEKELDRWKDKVKDVGPRLFP